MALETTSKINKPNELEHSEIAERARFLDQIIRNNPYNYPINEDELTKLLSAFRENNIELMDKYINFRNVYRKGKTVLVVKTHLKRKFFKVIVLENAYDIIKDAHITLGHGTIHRTHVVLEKDYLIPLDWVFLLINMCKFCQSLPFKNMISKNTICHQNIFHGTVAEMCIRSLVNISDSGFKYILIYVDQTTHYAIVRPLRTESVDEIAVELLKIFADFEPPEKIGVSKSLGLLVRQALIVLRSIEVPFGLPLVCSNINSDVLALSMANILRKDISAASDLDEKHWPIGMGSLQWRLNLKGHGVYESRFVQQSALKSQYHARFGVDIRVPNSKSDNQARVNSAGITKGPVPCIECQYPVYKLYRCVTCKLKPFHFTCCRRTVFKDGRHCMKVITMCFSCANKIK